MEAVNRDFSCDAVFESKWVTNSSLQLQIGHDVEWRSLKHGIMDDAILTLSKKQTHPHNLR